jgi:hypothetical protein
MADQLRVGLAAFTDQPAERCRRIAARLVDAKASALASRLDELPARIWAVSAEDRPDRAIREFGKIVLLTRAWRADPADPQAARDVGTAERRDDLVAAPAARTVTALWEVVGEQIRARRDGLVSHATWLMNLSANAGPKPRFALLLDFYPASAGRRQLSFTPGAQFQASLVFYPSAAPLRAHLLDRAELPERQPWPALPLTDDPLAQCRPVWLAVPWQLDFPLALPPGRIALTPDGRGWWRGANTTASLPLAGQWGAKRGPLPGIALQAAVGIWDGFRLTLLSALTPFGRLDFDS